MNTNADITIYNKRYNPQTRLDEWKATQIKGVSWFGSQKVAVGDKGLMSADTYIVRIPLAAAPTDKEFKNPDDYQASTDWTLQNGDIIAYGLKTDTDPKTIKSRKFVVTGWSDNRRGGLPHWKVEGK